MPPSDFEVAPVSKTRLWTGRVISAIPALFLLTGGIHLALFPTPDVREQFARFGFAANQMAPIGIVAFVCAVLYVIPRTSVLGAILLTGYLGGATATHVRMGEVTFVAPIVTGVLVWAGLYLRDGRLAALVPLRTLRADKTG